MSIPKILLNRSTPILMVLFLCFYLNACKDDDASEPSTEMIEIESQLDIFINSLTTSVADSTNLSMRVKEYMLPKPKSFFGSTVTMLDSNQSAIYSPYWFRSGDTLAFKNLAEPSYNIADQSWFKVPVSTGAAFWTKPYFDAGGGEIWMRTRAAPVIVDGKIIAIATTDLEVPKP